MAKNHCFTPPKNGATLFKRMIQEGGGDKTEITTMRTRVSVFIFL